MIGSGQRGASPALALTKSLTKPPSPSLPLSFAKVAAWDGEVLRAVLAGDVAPTAVGVKPIICAINAVIESWNAGRFVELGGYFYSNMNFVSLGGGAEAWRGFRQTVCLAKDSLTLHFSESVTPFWMKGSLLELVKQVNAGTMPLASDWNTWRVIGKELRDVRVRNRCTNQTVQIFVPAPAPEGLRRRGEKRKSDGIAPREYASPVTESLVPSCLSREALIQSHRP